MRSRILIVARDMALRARLARLVKDAGHGVELAENAEHVSRIGLDGVTVALVAPEGLGAEAKSLAAALDAKAIKAITFSSQEDEAALPARIAQALRPPEVAETSEPVLRFGGFRLDLTGHSLTAETGKDVPLTHGEFHLLRVFAQRPGRVLSRDQLLQMLAGRDAESYDRSIDMLVVRLRRKIEPDPKRPSLVVTVPGSGYKFAAKVTAEAGNAPVVTAFETTPVSPQPSLPATPERRQLTIMQCALTGPAFARAQRDPEDLQRLLADFHGHCEGVVAQAGGTIDRLLSDGILVYFGYPQADEHQAERAVRAALKLVAMTDQIDTGQAGRVQIRIGIATGLAVVGGQQGAPGALGEGANLAAKLASGAEPDAVLISASTRRLVGGHFACRASASLLADGATGGAVETWQVTGEGAAEGRFEALRGQNVTQLLGRDEELELLLRRWSQAKAGSGKVVLLSGEPGIGKSRLTRAVQDAVDGQPHIELRFFCSPHHQDSALYPVISQLERAAGFAQDDGTETKRIKLTTLLAQSNATEEAIGLIADLLSVPTDQRERIQQMSPQARRERTLAALLSQFSGLAAREPVLVIYEDIHWIDPTSRELLDHSIEQLERLPVLLLATFRPEFQPPWTGQANVTSLALTRLERSDTAAMIAAIAGGDTLLPEIAQEVADRTDGVPLFIEEVTKAVIEAGARLGEALSSMPRSGMSTPATLQASLLARLDRLGLAAKDIAQKGAVIGREFGYELIASVADRPEPELRAALEQLTHSGLLFARGVPPRSTYIFKHALVQDTAYSSLLRARRQGLHARVGGTLEQQSPKIVATLRPELLAHHFTEAGLAEKAVAFWLEAGQESLTRSALTEAVAQLRKGLEVLAGLPDGASRQQQELELQRALGPALAATKGYSSVEVGETLARARALAEQLNKPEHLVPLIHVQWQFHLVRCDLERALRLAEDLEAIGKSRRDAAIQLLGCRAQGLTRFMLGELVAARALFEPCLGLSDPAHRAVAAGLSEDPYATLVAQLAMPLAQLGYIDQARSRLDEGLSEATRLGHTHTLANVLSFVSAVDSVIRSPGLQRRAEEMATFCAEHSLSYWLARAIGHKGRALTLAGQAPEGLALLTQALARLRTLGTASGMSALLMWLAEAYAAIGHCPEALDRLSEAMRFVEVTGERYYEAELHRVRGDVLNTEGNYSAAERSYREALLVAGRQNAKLFELRSATSLARLWRRQKKHHERTGCSRPSTTGSAKASTFATCKRPKLCSKNSAIKAGSPPAYRTASCRRPRSVR